jgi:branched-chain amino acid transport system ATP-binding protein
MEMIPILRLQNISKTFSKYQVLSDVNLEISKGEKHALIGPNGSGKTTLFNLITGQYSPDQGAIYFKEKRIDHLPSYKRIRLGVGRSFQIINIFKGMTVYENLRNAVVAKNRAGLIFTRKLASLSEVEEKTDYILGHINLTAYRDEPSETLGYGQQRTLEIGLTIALDPELVLLDEPTAGLTPKETKEGVALISEVTAQKTLLIIEHDMDVVFDLADRISVLHQGRIVATESPEQIKMNKTVKEVYLGNLFDERSPQDG